MLFKIFEESVMFLAFSCFLADWVEKGPNSEKWPSKPGAIGFSVFLAVVLLRELISH